VICRPYWGDLRETNMRQGRLLTAIALAATIAVSGLSWTSPARAEQAGVAVYQVTVTNMASGQLLSPPLLVTHSTDFELFAVGERALDGVRIVAEEGNNAPLAAAVGAMTGVDVVVATKDPIHRVGGPGSSSMTMTIESHGADRLSLAMMLGCTNDGFTGLNSIKLSRSFVAATYYATGYDAGTEMNDQLHTHIPEGCAALGPGGVAPDGMNLRSATDEIISMHPGVTLGQGDLTELYTWPEPVAKITVQRVE
jgi:phosphohistidine swiveling domain-containing protein